MDFFGGNGVRWHGIPDFIFVLYDATHSLLGIAVGYGLLVAWKRALWLPISMAERASGANSRTPRWMAGISPSTARASRAW